MKKIILVSLATAFSTCMQIPALANPIGLNVIIECPKVDQLNNFGDYVGGKGTEIINSQNEEIYFKSQTLSQPINLNNYENYEAKYESQTGTVSCYYVNGLENSKFSVSYTLVNGKGGILQNSDLDNVSFTLPVGSH